MKRASRITAWLLLVCAFAPIRSQAAEKAGSHPVHHVERAASAIIVDGVLDEVAWQKATRIDLKYETRPGENTPPSVATEAFITYDDGHFYAAFRAHDPDPSAIRAHVSDRDNAFNDDFVGVVLDTFNDERRAFEFFVNPLGVQMDLFNDDVGGNEDSTWDAIWSAAGRIDADGYTVEIAIPLSSLRFPRAEGEQTWGLDALRFYPRSQRARISDHPLDRNVSCYLCQNSKITGFSGVTPGRNLELAPTVTSTRTDQRQREGGVRIEPGLTAKWGVTPSLTLNAALNPDFSQVEADAAQLNVNTQFALFFPEKRPFFLEGADFFSTPFNVVFTRNVADPSWGVKLTGKEGKNAVGVFAARDERTNLLFPGSTGSAAASLDTQTTDAVLRYRRDFGSSSAVGVLLTDREGEDGYLNHLAGIDGLYRITDADRVRLQLLRSRTGYPGPVAAAFGQPRGTFSDGAYQLAYNHDSRDWFAYGRYEDVGRDFRADLGFLPQVDYSFLLAGGGRVWNGDWRGFTRASLGADGDRREDQRGQRLEELMEVTADANGPLQSYATLTVGRRSRFFNGVTFHQTFSSLYSEMQPTGDLFLSLSANLGDEIDFVNTRAGRLTQLSPTVRYSLGRHLQAQVSHTYQRLDVDGGNLFTANLTQLTGVYQLNVRTFLRAIFQYTDVERTPGLYVTEVDRRTRTLFSQLLFSYKLNPQTVFFAGYSDDSAALGRTGLARTDRTFFLKLGYAWVP